MSKIQLTLLFYQYCLTPRLKGLDVRGVCITSEGKIKKQQ